MFGEKNDVSPFIGRCDSSEKREIEKKNRVEKDRNKNKDMDKKLGLKKEYNAEGSIYAFHLI